MQYLFILNVALFVSSALSKPAALTPLNDRIARRRGGSHHGGLPKIVGTSAGTSDGTYNVAASAPAAKVANVIQYSSNWAGAVLLAPPVAGTMFNSVLGTFTVPTPSVPTGGKVGTYAASLWVGIDGDTAQQSIWQAGIDVTAVKSSTGKVTLSYDTWYEWYPNYATDFTTAQFSFKAGDIIQLTLTAATTAKGSVIIKNLTTGKSFTQAGVSPNAAANLKGANAEWIVEDFQQNGALVPFANFGTVTFSQCSAGTSDGKTVGTTNAQLLAIKSAAGVVLTNVSVPDAKTVKIVYSGS